MASQPSPNREIVETWAIRSLRQAFFLTKLPKGWAVKSTPLSKYDVAVDTQRNDFVANINVVVEAYPESLAQYVSLNKQMIAASGIYAIFQIVDEQPFETSTGVKGVRLVAKDQLNKQDMQQIFYFFEGPSKNKFVVTASCLTRDGDQYAPVFDASVKTFSPLQGPASDHPRANRISGYAEYGRTRAPDKFPVPENPAERFPPEPGELAVR